MKLLHEELTFAVIGAAMEVHRHLKNGFLENVYEKALAHELKSNGFVVERQVPRLVQYKGTEVGHYVVDLLINELLVVEVKSLTPAHFAQTLNYLAATDLQLALLLNFGSRSLQHKRVVRENTHHKKSAPISANPWQKK